MTHTSEATPGMTSAARFIFAALGEPPRPAPASGVGVDVTRRQPPLIHCCSQFGDAVAAQTNPQR